MTLENLKMLRHLIIEFMALEATFAEEKMLGPILRIVQNRIDRERNA